MPYQDVTLGPFGGLNQDENPHNVGDNELIASVNIAHFGGMIGTRPGMIYELTGKEYENPLTGANAVVGLHEHRENVDAGRHLLAISKDAGTGRVFYTDADVLPAGPTITYAQDNFWTLASFNNLTYAAGGAAADDFWHWNGNTGAAPTALAVKDSAGATVRPRYVFAWRNNLFINGLRGGTLYDNNPSSTRFVDPLTDPTVAANWGTGNTIGFNAYGKSHTTGMASFRSNNGDWLLILTNNGLAAVEATAGFPYFQVTDAVANGCVGQRAFVNLGLDSGDAIYMSDHGFHSLRQSQAHGAQSDEFLSWKIRPFFATLRESRKQYTVGAYDFVTGRVVFSVSIGSSSTHNRLLVLDLKDEEEVTADSARWSVWQLGVHPDTGSAISINELKMARDEDEVWRLYFGTTDGDVGYFTESTFSDLGSSYPVKMQTKHQDFGSTMTTKTLGDLMVTLQPGGTYEPAMKFHFDYGARQSTERRLVMPAETGSLWGTGLWGSALWGAGGTTRDDKVYGSGSGRTISMEITHGGGNEPFRVGKIVAQIDVAGEDTGSIAA